MRAPPLPVHVAADVRLPRLRAAADPADGGPADERGDVDDRVARRAGAAGADERVTGEWGGQRVRFYLARL